MNYDKPKVALCILATDYMNNIWSWSIRQPFFQEHFNLYIHPKSVNSIPQDLRKYVMPQHMIVETKWGHISLVYASLMLFQQAYIEDVNEYFILLSDNSIPAFSWEDIYASCMNDIRSGKGRLNWYSGSQTRYHGLPNPKPFPITKFMKHPQWFSMTRNGVKYYLQPSNQFLHIFQNIQIPDEHYFYNVLTIRHKSVHEFFTNRQIMDTVWDHRISLNHPVTFSILTKEHLKRVQLEGSLFIRKMLPHARLCTEYMEMIGMKSINIETPVQHKRNPIPKFMMPFIFTIRKQFNHSFDEFNEETPKNETSKTNEEITELITVPLVTPPIDVLNTLMKSPKLPTQSTIKQTTVYDNNDDTKDDTDAKNTVNILTIQTIQESIRTPDKSTNQILAKANEIFSIDQVIPNASKNLLSTQFKHNSQLDDTSSIVKLDKKDNHNSPLLSQKEVFDNLGIPNDIQTLFCSQIHDTSQDNYRQNQKTQEHNGDRNDDKNNNVQSNVPWRIPIEQLLWQ